MSIVRNLYGALTLAASFPLSLIMLASRRGRSRLKERFGLWSLSLPECLWFHGASLGEINGLVPLMNRFKAQYPTLPILVTATSISGLERAAGSADYVRLLPFDNSLWLKLAMRDVKPRALVFAETELWPCLIDEVAACSVPLYLVNARISDFSYSRYKAMRKLLEPGLKKISLILTANEVSRLRFIELGAVPDRVKVAGNAKYDIKPLVASSEEALKLRRLFFSDDHPTLVLGSLRPGEEDVWFPALKAALQSGAKLNVVVAPRHQEKFDFFASRLNQVGLKFERWSERQVAGCRQAANGKTIILLDTLGDLSRVYSFADASFIGATLVPIGGHNPLEPAPYRSCLVLGPYVNNVADIVELLKEQGGCYAVKNSQDVKDFLSRFCARDEELKLIGSKAFEVWQSMAGAVDRIMAHLKLQGV